MRRMRFGLGLLGFGVIANIYYMGREFSEEEWDAVKERKAKFEKDMDIPDSRWSRMRYRYLGIFDVWLYFCSFAT